MVAKYKQKCVRCRKNYVLASWRDKYPVCYGCQKKELEGEIKDPKMRKMFDIPEGFYRENSFLRDIKIKYLKYGRLSDKQIEAFRKTVKEMKDEADNVKGDSKGPR